MAKKYLVIVESPSKASTIKKILGKNYDVVASVGHIKNLPKSKIGVDIENDFTPKYITIKGKGPVIKKIKDKVKKVDRVYLAADPDREGEAIAWHLAEMLKLKEKKSRIEFNEITKTAVKAAVKKPREINMDRVNAQQARRILDRLVGYKITPLLWQVLSANTSAGRVQSVALKLICKLEEKIKAFVPEKYWEVSGLFNEKMNLDIHKIDGKKVGKIKDETLVDELKKALKGKSRKFEVISTEVSKKSKKPPLPLRTSTLQQLGSSYLGFSSSKTMMVAQSLYEGINLDGNHIGLITYMRTDSTRISDEAKKNAQKYIKEIYGEEYVGDYKSKEKKDKKVQDAHEAIRPTDVILDPEKIKKHLKKDQYKLYKLIWERFLISQFSNMKYEQFKIINEYEKYQFRGIINKVTFPGYYKIFKEDDEIITADFPEIKKGEIQKLSKLNIKEGETKPPSRLSEASLVKQLEKEGIGRPSTYSSIIATIKKRKYVELKNKSFIPTKLGFDVVKELEKYFPKIMDIKFTAEMEDTLDEVEEGTREWKEVLKEFYSDFEIYLKKYEKEVKLITDRKIVADIKCPICGGEMLLKTGRFGKFLECEGYEECKQRFSLPKNISIPKKDIEAGKITVKKEVEQVLKEKNGVMTDLKCEKCSGKMLIKKGRFGQYLECENYKECQERSSLPKGIDLSEENGIIMIKDQILKERSEDRKAIEEAGKCEKCGSPFIVKKGRFGKFLACSNYPNCKNIQKYPGNDRKKDGKK